jgi:hypothetical protein
VLMSKAIIVGVSTVLFQRKYKISVTVLCSKHIGEKGKNEHERRRHFLAISGREVFRSSSHNNRSFVPLFHGHEHNRFGSFHRALRFLEHLDFDYWLVPAFGQTTRIVKALLSSFNHYSAVRNQRGYNA